MNIVCTPSLEFVLYVDYELFMALILLQCALAFSGLYIDHHCGICICKLTSKDKIMIIIYIFCDLQVLIMQKLYNCCYIDVCVHVLMVNNLKIIT